MSYVTGHWSSDPFLPITILLTCWHEIGLIRLGRRSRPAIRRRRRARSLLFYAGLVALAIAVCSPIDYWASDYFFMHMIQHLLLMFAAPALVVAGAPWQPLLAALPGGLRHRLVHLIVRARTTVPRAPTALTRGPWLAIALFNAVMIAWHVPALFDLAERSQAVHIWLMHGSFFGAGMAFWAQFIPSPPLHRRMPLVSRAAALVGTNLVMVGLAMALGLFSSASWYPVYAHVPGVILPPFTDQQIGAAILWVCGELWAVPALGIVISRLLADADTRPGRPEAGPAVACGRADGHLDEREGTARAT